MSLCKRCSNGEYHGFHLDDTPATISFWCPVKEISDSTITLCDCFSRGKVKLFDKFHNQIEVKEESSTDGSEKG